MFRTTTHRSPRLAALALAAPLAFAGCEPTATNTPQSLAQERAASQQMVRQLEAQNALVEDRSLNAYVRQVVNKIEAARPAGAVPITPYIVKEADVNAYTPGGGDLFVNAGLIAAMENEAQLATVLAHEIAHIDLGHVQANRQTQAGVQLGAAAAQIGGALLGLDPQLTQLGVGLGAQAAVTSFTRDQERGADAQGGRYVANAGYSLAAGAESFTVLRRLYGDAGIPFLSSHPASAEREQALLAEAQRLGATQGYVGESEYDAETRALRREALQYYEQSGRSREARQVAQNLRN